LISTTIGPWRIWVIPSTPIPITMRRFSSIVNNNLTDNWCYVNKPKCYKNEYFLHKILIYN
jgi:hypothetical protein